MMPHNAGITVHAFFATPAAAPPAEPGPSALLTPDTLLAYCSQQLTNLNSQINAAIEGQQQTIHQADAIRDVLGMLGNVSGGIKPGGRAATDIIQHFEAAIQQAGPGSDVGRKLQAALDGFAQRCGPDMQKRVADGSVMAAPNDHCDGNINELSADDMKSVIDGVQGIQTSLNQNSELAMLSVQSLMSQRQTAVQLTTNLVQALGDQYNKIAANVGH